MIYINPFSAGHDPHGAKKAAYLRQISNREDALAYLKSKEPQLFAHIWSNMSKETRAQVEKIQQQKADYSGELMYVDNVGAPVQIGEDGAVSPGAIKVPEVELWSWDFTPSYTASSIYLRTCWENNLSCEQIIKTWSIWLIQRS